MTRRLLAALLFSAVALAGCGDPSLAREPVSNDDGMQLTGTLDGQRIAISRGLPIVTLGDCDPQDGLDDDLCINARTIDGLDVIFVFENPDALVVGVLEVAGSSCRQGCDVEGPTLVVDVIARDETRRATSGTVELTQAGPRYAGTIDVTLPFGDRLIGTFDVVPAE